MRGSGGGRASPGPDGARLPAVREVEVWTGRWGDPVPLFGPLPGRRDADAVAYEFELPEPFVPREGGSRLERVFALLDVGVSMSRPVWRGYRYRDGLRTGLGIDHQLVDPVTWYVDLVHVTDEGDRLVLRDLYLDVMVPTDGRHPRHLDLEELADAVADGTVPAEVAVDGMRRWQSFLDRHLHDHRYPTAAFCDFPPAAFSRLADLPAPLGPVVTYQG